MAGEITKYDDQPPLGQFVQTWRPNTEQDPAKRLIYNQNLIHRRPTLAAGNQIYVWPLGVEGFRRTGTAMLGIHRYLGDHHVDVQVMHRDEARIELSGLFAGLTAQANMVNLIQVLVGITPKLGKILTMPGVFDDEQYVWVENYEFSHGEDDRTHSISYNISFVRTGTGRKLKDPIGDPPQPNPTIKTDPRGAPARYITTKDGLRTFRAIAKKAYGHDTYWGRVVGYNKNVIAKFQAKRKINIPSHRLPTYRWPIGMKFRV